MRPLSALLELLSNTFWGKSWIVSKNLQPGPVLPACSGRSQAFCLALLAWWSVAWPQPAAGWPPTFGKGPPVPDWLLPLLNSPLAGGVASGLLFLGGVKVELRRLDEKARAALASVQRVHVRLDDHIDRHHTAGVARGR